MWLRRTATIPVTLRLAVARLDARGRELDRGVDGQRAERATA
jgi:hypothetical protein